MIIYENVIKGKGNSVGEFGTEMFILFGENAPDTLKDFCYLIDLKEADSSIEVGQTLHIDDESFKILAVGDIAQRNLESLGHLTVNFSGDKGDVLPGSIVVEKKDHKALDIGTVMKIEK